MPEVYARKIAIRVNVREDHMHMVVMIPPRVAVAVAVKYIKTHSAKILRAKFPFLRKVYYGQEGIWPRGYYVSSLGLKEKKTLWHGEYQTKDDTG